MPGNSWPTVETVEGVLITLIIPLAPSLSAAAACLKMDSDILGRRSDALALARPRLRRGVPVGLPPAGVLCFLQFAAGTEPTLDMPVWPTLKDWRRAYLGLVLRLAPSFAAAGDALKVDAQVLARMTRALELPEPAGQRQAPMPAPPVELGRLLKLAGPTVGTARLMQPTTFTVSRLPAPTDCTLWLLPRQAV